MNDLKQTTWVWEKKNQKEQELLKEKRVTKLRQDKLKEQFKNDKLQRFQYELKMEFLRKDQEKARTTSAKLPKLVITNFDGAATDWMRFWNQFESEIDQADVPAVTSSLTWKNPKIKPCIDGLHFSIEGYQRAKNILQSKFEVTNEIVSAYVQNIMDLPNVQRTHGGKIDAFYDKLLTFNHMRLWENKKMWTGMLACALIN